MNIQLETKLIERRRHALSLGLTANFADDHALLAQGLILYDAL